MIRLVGLFVMFNILTSLSFSQTFSKDNRSFVYQNRITYQIKTVESSESSESKTFLKILKKAQGEFVELKTTEISSKIQDIDLITFGAFINKKRKFILINSRYSFYILNFYNNKLLGPYSPKFWGVGQDAQSGMISDLKIIMQGRFLIGYCVDSGTFLYDLTDLYKPFDAGSANIPYYHENHVYILNRADNKQKQFALFVSTNNWKVNSKLIFNNKSISLEDYSYINNFSELEIEKKLTNYSTFEHKYTILKEILTDNNYRYLVIDNDNGDLINIPAKIRKSDKTKLKKYLEKL